jgi:uncharacterized membrane protein YqjE
VTDSTRDEGRRSGEASLSRLAAALIDLLRTRLELASTELEEALARVGVLLLGAIVAVLFLSVSIVTLAVLVVAALWDSYRLASIAALVVLFALSGTLAAFWTVRGMRRFPGLFPATARELARDGERLAGSDR